jgi:predicted MFS family arabinose efflux permease
MTVVQSAPGSARVRHHRVVRPAVLVAVLLGLFLMHGGPAAADGGCHGAMPATAPMRHTPATTAMQQTSATHAPDHSRAAAGHQAAVYADGSMRGALCQATTPRPGIPLPPLGAVAVVLPAVVPLPWARQRPGRSRRRGPPGGGRDLLLQVCVART